MDAHTTPGGSTHRRTQEHEDAAPVRVVTATSLFDGHDAAINIVRRILQQHGAEVIHLGHDRSVGHIVTAAIQEDADAIAVSSYQGGHNEFFRYLVSELRARDASHVRIYGGGGGTILPGEATALQADGVTRIFSPEDGRDLGLSGMVASIIEDCRRSAGPTVGAEEVTALGREASDAQLARVISAFEGHASQREESPLTRALADRVAAGAGAHTAVVGLTGTGGAGKSSVVDELVRRFRLADPEGRIGLLLVDPTRRRSGGALLGDRIRLNAVHPRTAEDRGVFVRSLATRARNRSVAAAIDDAIAILKVAEFDLVLVETAGIGQSDSEIVDRVDTSVYVMTPEYGAPTQLEKIDMLELADMVIVNKIDRQGGPDALRDVRKQWRRNHVDFGADNADLPVFGTTASAFLDPGVDAAFEWLRARVAGTARAFHRGLPKVAPAQVQPPRLAGGYLAEVAKTVRGYHEDTERLCEAAERVEALSRVIEDLEADSGGDSYATVREAMGARREMALRVLDEGTRHALEEWPRVSARYAAPSQTYRVRGREIEAANQVKTLAGSELPRVALPRTRAWGELTRYLREENRPGEFPFTAGVFPFERKGEAPGRMFAGEGTPERTNRRFHFLASGQPAVRLSTAFDSVTLYGRDPAEPPDIYGKVGNSGVSVCTLDDAKKLYSGFDLCAPNTSVSMTINGPAPVVLAFFLNTAIDQQVEMHLRSLGELDAVRARHAPLPHYREALPAGHDGLGLGLLGIAGDEAVAPDVYARIRADVLARVRGTVQADILKEDQAQNTCIFSTAFALSLMGDIQRFFVDEGVRNFYSVSVSGYHIAEAGANPITQLAFTLANGFTLVEYYLSRGMAIDDFVGNFSFFFSNGLDAEYSVLGRVARRIWAIAMRDRYGAGAAGQRLKYHVQTSGRSLHAQEMAFNDIRTTLQALTALQDRCNSLHTNAYDEAVTTPTEASVRRALAIQLIIQQEFGLSGNENPLQGSYVIEQLTDLVEAAVLSEFDRLSARGGVLGAMETLYQRSKIQDESLVYESRKHSGELPVIGVNTFQHPDQEIASSRPTELARSSDAEKRAQLEALSEFHTRHASVVDRSLAELARAARAGDNLFATLMQTTKHASLGQICDTLFELGGEYRRAM